MDKNLNYTIRVNLVDQASNSADGVNRRLQQMAESAQQAAPRFNQLNMSIQQVARELPAFSYSISTGFMAISNNLPILADTIAQVRKENAVLAASGQQVVPVWRQVAGSLLSWQTALVAGVTALTMYGPEIVGFIRNLFSLSDASNQSRMALEALRNTTQSYGENLLQETNQLRYIYDAIYRTSEGTAARRAAIQTLNDTYKEYMPYLLSERSSLDELASMYDILNTALRNHIALKVRNAQLDKITEEAAKTQSKAIEELQEALSKQEVSTSLSDDIIATLVNDVPKWKAAGDTLREAFLQAVRNIQTDSGITVSRDAERGIYDYIQSFYQMDTAVEAVNRRLDLMQGKTDQIRNLGTLVVTPEAGKDTDKELNKDLNTIGGLTNRINELRKAQSEASTENAINLEKEIQLYQQRLDLLNLTISKGAAGRLADDRYKDLLPSSMPTFDLPKLELPVGINSQQLQKMHEDFQRSLAVYVEDAEIAGRQIGGILTNSIASFAQNLGQAIASGEGWDVFRSMLTSVMGMLQQFGATLIAAGTAALAFQSLLLNPIAAIVAGAALVATAAAARAALQSATTAFANGGIVSGPTLALVGEYPGAPNNPEVIAPLNKLKSMIDPAVPNDTTMSGEVRFVIRGEVLEGILNKMNRKRMRTR